MTVANQIGLGVCLALTLYVVWIAGTAALNILLDWVAPPPPIQLLPMRVVSSVAIQYPRVVNVIGPTTKK